ncbi:MAG: hypothetical protein ACOC33_01265 [bacterium]
MKTIEEKQILIEKLQEKENIIELLIETLKFYADRDNYQNNVGQPQVIIDKGELANNVINRVLKEKTPNYQNLINELYNIQNKINTENNIDNLKQYLNNANVLGK